jgi:hypothetical protein
MKRTCVMTLVVLMVPVLAAAQGTTPAATAWPQGAVQAQLTMDPDADLQLVPSEPDFTLGVLPTTLRLPKHKMAFRITHRFTYKINDGSVGDFFENGLGFDSSATSGFELRFGVASGTQVVVHRTGNRNIQFLGQHQLQSQRVNGRFSADILFAIEGQDNFTEEHSIVVGGVGSHQFGDQGAVYVQPIGVFNAVPEVPSSDENTLILGMGVRWRILESKNYVVAEWAPRLTGYDGGSSVMLFGFERRVGGHSFQLNLSNAFGTTLTQVGHGGPRSKHWHLGFNLTRKFY